MNIIEIKDLTKTFSYHKKKEGLVNSLVSLFKREYLEKKAVNKVSFQIKEGEFVGFLGPNGAGKTTTLKMLSGILHPTSGVATVLDYKPWIRQNEYLKQIGIVMGQKSQLIWDIPAVDTLKLFKEIYEIPDSEYKKRLNELASILNIKDVLDVSVRKLSLGQRMKCELVAALIHRPKVLFLDEPTIGLDVVSKKRIWDFLSELNQKEKTTIILTSHYMEDIKRLCKRVIIINNGGLIYDGMLKNLVDKHLKNRIINVDFSKEISEEKFKNFGEIIKFEDSHLTLSVKNKDYKKVTKTLLDKFPVEDISITAPDAEEVIREMFEKR